MYGLLGILKLKKSDSNAAKGKKTSKYWWSLLLIDESATLSHKSALIVYLLCSRDDVGDPVSFGVKISYYDDAWFMDFN